MQIKKEFVLREIAGDFVLVPIGKTAAEFTGLFPLTETAARIWELLPESATAEDIVNTLLQEYEVEKDVLTADVADFLNKLKKFGIID